VAKSNKKNSRPAKAKTKTKLKSPSKPSLKAKGKSKAAVKPAAKKAALSKAKSKASAFKKATTSKAKSNASAVKKTSAQSSVKVKSKLAPHEKAAKASLEKIQPLGDRLFVTVENAQEKRTAGGLYIPDTVNMNESYIEGRVLAVGSGRRDKKGKLKPMEVAVGDKVLFASYAGTSVELNQGKFFFVSEDQVIGIKKS
jgi:chaperonin GroES